MLAGVLIMLASLAAGGDTLSGRVVDRDGHAVPGATVLVAELHRVALTGSDGRFRLADMPAGRYAVTVRGLGYAPIAREVTIAGPTTLDVTLARTSVWVEPVTVTATRAPLDAGAAPLPTAALSEDRLRREQSVSLAHTLAQLPGVNALATGQQIGKPVIRGLSGPRVLVLEDGSRLEDYSWSDEDGPSVDARLAQRVEVIRGPASVLYGSDALGGVVNVIPEELPDANRGPKMVRTGFELSGASNNTELDGAARVEGAAGTWGWRLVGIGRFGSSLHTPAGELDNTGFSALSGEAALGTRGARGSTTLRLARYGGEFKLLEAGGPASGETGGPERKLSDNRVQLVGDYLLSGVRLETKAQWQRHSLIEVSDTGVSPGGEPLEGTAFDLLLNTFSFDVLAHHTAGARVTGTLGVSGLAQSNDTRGRIPLVPDARVRTGAVFAFEQAALGRVSLLAGARLDVRRLTADSNTTLGLSSQTRDYTAFAGNVGLVYRAGAAALTANLGRAWRAPTLFELFSNGPHLGEARYEIGDPALQPEAGTNLDLALRWQRGRVRAELAGYRNAIGRFVYITPTDSFVHVTPTDSLRVYRYQHADARLLGGEASLEMAVSAPLTIRARADAVRGTNQATREPLPLIPPARGAVGAELHGDGLGWADRAYVGAEVEVATRQTRLNPLDIATGGYALLNVSTGIERPLLGRDAHIDLAVRNATNVSYRSFLSRYKEFALDPGRNITVRVSIGE
ncbi:MAG TPA: TonB-dependent receptor [Gemmatimonadales bacterium]|nr:TonB-dependent receptor [Gemmatimonadales bacterium]